MVLGRFNYFLDRLGCFRWLLWMVVLYLGKYCGITVLSCLLSTKPCLKFVLICFAAWEIKGFYQSSLTNQVDFRDIINVSPSILAKN